MAYRERSVPLRPARQRKRYAKLQRDENIDRLQDEWCARCSVHYAMLLLDNEVRRGSMLFAGTWRGHCYAVLATELPYRPGAANAVSAWSAPSIYTALLRLAFRWSQLMRGTWDDQQWGISISGDDISWPIEGCEKCQ